MCLHLRRIFCKRPILMKTHLLLICLLCSTFHAYSQTHPVVSYLEAGKDYSVICNGEIELAYNSNIYENPPYFEDANFVSGEITFMNQLYPRQMVR